jgi:hypothetical protein
MKLECRGGLDAFQLVTVTMPFGETLKMAEVCRSTTSAAFVRPGADQGIPSA